MTNNFEKNNFEPFKHKIFKDENFNFKTFINDLPIIPSVYFKKDDTIGSNIINAYYTVKINLEKLETIKKFILTIIDSSLKNQLEKINIDTEKHKYKLFRDNLIFKFNNSLSETFPYQNDFVKFHKKFVSENSNLFKNIKTDVPLFFYLFQEKYTDNSKTYFINLFKEYIDVRKILLNYIKDNYGLLAFTSFFDLYENIDFKKLKDKCLLKIKIIVRIILKMKINISFMEIINLVILKVLE